MKRNQFTVSEMVEYRSLSDKGGGGEMGGEGHVTQPPHLHPARISRFLHRVRVPHDVAQRPQHGVPQRRVLPVQLGQQARDAVEGQDLVRVPGGARQPVEQVRGQALPAGRKGGWERGILGSAYNLGLSPMTATRDRACPSAISQSAPLFGLKEDPRKENNGPCCVLYLERNLVVLQDAQQFFGAV